MHASGIYACHPSKIHFHNAGAAIKTMSMHAFYWRAWLASVCRACMKRKWPACRDLTSALPCWMWPWSEKQRETCACKTLARVCRCVLAYSMEPSASPPSSGSAMQYVQHLTPTLVPCVWHSGSSSCVQIVSALLQDDCAHALHAAELPMLVWSFANALWLASCANLNRTASSYLLVMGPGSDMTELLCLQILNLSLLAAQLLGMHQLTTPDAGADHED